MQLFPVHRLAPTLREEGALRTLLKVLRYPYVFGRMRFDREYKFTAIYRKNFWGEKESKSGAGSTLEQTANLRRQLPELLRTFSIGKLFDAPCGDFNWMRHLTDETGIEYVGGDIVPPLIEANQAKYGNSRRSFIRLDLTQDRFPAADLMLCRDCLFHLSFRDTRAIIRNFVDSGIPYLLTTTYVNRGQFRNRDITTGGFHFIDLFSPPYCFPREVLFRIEDGKAPYPEREMCLWSAQQLAAALTKFR